MRYFGLDEVADSFIDGCHTGEVVGAKNRRAVARYGSILMGDGFFAFCRLNSVHVGRKENRGSCKAARNAREQIARIGAGLLLRMIFCKRNPDFGEFYF